jgi:hypothetical protein
LVDDVENLKLESDEKIDSYEIKHNLKCEEIFLFKNNEVSQYDKFTNEYLPSSESNIDEFTYIKKSSKNKNFIFHYKPNKIEDLANDLYTQSIFENIEKDDEIQKIIDTLSKEVDENFYINKTINKGIIYIHAKMPNIIKEYLEYQFNKVKKFKYIIANTVLLEGINLPIDNLYIASTDDYQNGKDLVNLIGRVNRLNYVFQEKDLNKLISSIHFVSTEKYQNKKHDMKNKIEELREHSFTDEIQNPLMAEYDIDKLSLSNEEKKKKKLKNQEIIEHTNFLIQDNNTITLGDKIKKYFIQNNIDDFYNDLDFVIDLITKKINAYKDNTNFKNADLVLKIYWIFIKQLEEKITDFEIERLKNKKAQNYYKNYLEKMQKLPLKNNINSTYRYFKTKADSNEPKLFIGTTYGETTKETKKYENKKYQRNVYIDLAKYKNDDSKLINLAIVKLKIEEDFISFKLNKLINFMYDFDLISKNEYNLHTYGTDNEKLIKLSKIGLNVNIISKLIEDNQNEKIGVDDYGNLIPRDGFKEYVKQQSELFQFEINKYLR